MTTRGLSAAATDADEKRGAGCWRFNFLCSCALALVFTAVIFHYVRVRGRLVVVPTYDDASYLCDGLERYNAWLERGNLGLLGSLWAHPPHTPYSTLVAFASYAVFGPHQWAPYMGSGVLVLGVLLFVCRLMRGTGRLDRLAALLLVLCVPVAGNAVAEFRPDIAGAVLTSIAVILLAARPVPASRRYLLATGLFLALALLAKPTAFPNTLALCGAAAAFAGVRQVLAKRKCRWREFWLDAATVAAPVLVLAGPYYVRHGRHVVEYIYRNTWGGSQSLWLRPMDAAGQFRYYLTGDGGRFMLGRDCYLLLAICAIGGLAVVRRQPRQRALVAASFAALLAMALAIPLANPVKQEFFGANFQVLLVFGAVMAVRTLLLMGAGPRAIGRVALYGGLIWAAAAFQWPNAFGTPADRLIADQNAAARGITDLIVREVGAGATPRVYIGSVGTVSSDALRFLALQRAAASPAYVMPFDAEPAAVEAELDRAGFVVATDGGVAANTYDFPANQAQQRTLDAVRARQNYREIGFFPVAGQKGYHLFRNYLKGDPFEGTDGARGLAEREGPYPQWKLPLVRWGVAPETSVAMPAGRVLIVASSLSQVPDQVAEFLVDGKVVERLAYPRVNQFYPTLVELDLAGGARHVLTIRYRTGSATDANHAVLFRRLAVRVLPPAGATPARWQAPVGAAAGAH